MLAKCDVNREALGEAIDSYKGFVKDEHGEDAKVYGLGDQPLETLKDRAECLEEILKAGIPVSKIDKLRPYLERRMGISLTHSKELSRTFIPPLKLKEEALLRREFKDEFVGAYSDGTTHHGESFNIVYRACKKGFNFRVCAVRVRFLRGSMNANQIASELMDCHCSHMLMKVSNLFAFMTDCVSANLAAYRDSLSSPFLYSEHNGCLPHTGSHVGEHMDVPHVDEFMALYNAIVGLSNYAVVFFAEITGYTAKKKSATRWFSTNDVQELSLLPNVANGKLLKWADKLIHEGICEATAPF